MRFAQMMNSGEAVDAWYESQNCGVSTFVVSLEAAALLEGRPAVGAFAPYGHREPAGVLHCIGVTAEETDVFHNVRTDETTKQLRRRVG